ncbi:hypothetical protein QFC24_006312 [Naganishia onofrii]|uniref:Uncharacterized protein n=1 Tax=Naganishia onofrii TaxID=1851511 RepID=A0ACC2X372_9TREE|nr:hypothetical protein QFC24_006312 [Naganishia onofrii]
MAETQELKYLSTRGGDERLTFEEAVLRGLAPNGGLYIPDRIPALPSDWQTAWSGLSFPDLSFRILSLFIPTTSIPSADLKDIIDRSYATFRHENTTPLKQVNDREFVLELWHGPTFAFKDVALQFLGNVFEYCLKRKNAQLSEGQARHKLTVVGATSGDTGSAAIYGLRGKQDISIFILYPWGRVSPIQEAQMATVPDENVHCVAVDGTFDDCQDTVKTLFADAEFNGTHRLGAINSINWARILAQIVYYFHAYLSLPASAREGGEITFSVPTGNFGDVLAGWYAKRLGLPMRQLVVATNENDILARFWANGMYSKPSSEDNSSSSKTSHGDAQAAATEVAQGSSDGAQAEAKGGVKETLSPAMDILVSSNFERLLFYLAYDTQAVPSASAAEKTDAAALVPGTEGAGDAGDARDRVRRAQATVQAWMTELKTNGKVDLRQVWSKAKEDFVAERVSDDETVQQIRKFYSREDKYGPYVVDPHTAVGLAATERVIKNSPATTTFVTLSTAHPAKFDAAVQQALPSSQFPSFDFRGQVMPDELKLLDGLEKRVTRVPGEQGVRKLIERVALESREATPVQGAGGL